MSLPRNDIGHFRSPAGPAVPAEERYRLFSFSRRFTCRWTCVHVPGKRKATISRSGWLFSINRVFASNSRQLSVKLAYLESRHFGPVKIREVKYTYEIKDETKTIALDAGSLVKAILKDALDGSTDFMALH